MKCGDYDGRCESMARGPSAVGLQLNFSGERGVPLAIASRVLRKPARPIVLEPPTDARNADHNLPTDVPFMNDMDEISYWIHTKRAPCLMNYDNLIRKQSEEAQCSKAPKEEVSSPRKRKKKRKLSLLDNDSVSTEKQQNVYFDMSHRQNEPLIDSCESDTLGSDVEFNIKNALEKPKRARLQKNSRTKIHKRNKVVTSTPKTTANLRRSLRQAQQNNNNAHLNSSFEMYTTMVSNGHAKNNGSGNRKPIHKVNKSTQIFEADDQPGHNKRNTIQRNKSKNTTDLNGQFEDLSDVSGFTANYIRSTKVQSSKTPRKLRCKSSRNLVKETEQNSQDDSDNMVVHISKSTNTGGVKANMLNCSTDSSQNVMNFVTSKNNDKSTKVDKSTSLLKFVDTRAKSKDKASNRVDSKLKSKSNLNISFQSQSSGTSRYPKRYKNPSDVKADNSNVNARKSGKTNGMEFNNSDKKENPEDAVISRTRSGRNVARRRESSVLVVSNSTEQVSSMVSMNVASPNLAEQRRKRTTRLVRAKKSVNKSGQSLRRDSLRNKSGFAACFSDSDDDSLPLIQRKYFCN